MRDYFQNIMKQTKFKPLPSHGSYFQCYDYGEVSNMPDNDFAIELTKKCGVVTIPLSSFYSESKDYKVLRFCFAKKEETLEKAAEKLMQADFIR